MTLLPCSTASYSAYSLQQTLSATAITPDDSNFIATSKYISGVALTITIVVIASLEMLASIALRTLISPPCMQPNQAYSNLTKQANSATTTMRYPFFKKAKR